MTTQDTLMALATDFGVNSLRVGSYERKDIYENSSVASYKTVDLRKEREISRAALSAAIAELIAARENTLEILKRIEPKVDALIAERDALAKDAARYRYLRDKCHDDWGRVYFPTVEIPLNTGLAGRIKAIDAAIDSAMKGTPT